MKKLIVLSVIFALVAGSVFAADIGVEVFGKAEVLNGNDKQEYKESKDDGTPVYGKQDKNGDGFGIARIRMNASGATEDGTIGGSLRLNAGSDGAALNGYGWVWWKPSDLFKLQIGSNAGDGEFGLEGVTGWGYYQLACETIISNGNTWGGGAIDGLIFRNAFFGGWNAPGVIFTVTPIEALAVNIAIPYTSQDAAYKDYLKFTAQVKYDIEGVGTAGITYQNGFGHEDGTRNGGGPTYGGETNDPSKLFLYFGLSSIENLGIDIGIGLKLPSAVDHTETYGNVGTSTEYKSSEKTETYTYPLNVGIGVNFSSGALGVKARILGEFLGSKEIDKVGYDSTGSKITTGNATENYKMSDGWGMLIDVQPSYAVNEKLTAYLSLGVGFVTGWDERDPVLDSDGNQKVDGGNAVFEIKPDPQSRFAWHVQPYIVITPSYWNGAFFAGFRLDSSSDKYDTPDKDGKEVLNRTVNWSIPIGITFSF